MTLEASRQALPIPVVAALAFLMGATAFAVDASVPAIPATTRFFETQIGAVQLTVGLYMLGYGLGQIPVGFIADAIGRRPVVLTCMSLFVVMGIIASQAPTVDILLVSRFLQGLFGASGAVLSRAIARDITDGAQTARLMSLLTSTLGITMIVAPVIGATALLWFGWRAPFAASSLLGFLGVVLVFLFVPESRPISEYRSPLRRLSDGLTAFFASRVSFVCAILVGASFAGLITFVTLSSAVFIVGFKMTEIGFAFVYVAVSVGYVFGGLICRRLLNQYSALEISRWVAAGFLLGSLCIGLMFGFELKNLWLILIVLMFLFACISSMLSLATSIALEPLAATAGMGAALLGTVQLLIGSVVAIGVSQIPYPPFKLLLLIVGSCSICVFVMSFVLQKMSKHA